MATTPKIAMTMNHSSMTGPNARPMRCVPNRWVANSTTRISNRRGHDERLQRIGGDVDALERAQHRDRRRDDAVAVNQRRAEQPHRRSAVLKPGTKPFAPTSDISARMPPSPRLSARITNRQYLIDTVMIKVQTMSERMPSASGREPAADGLNHGLQGVQRAGSQVAEDDAERGGPGPVRGLAGSRRRRIVHRHECDTSQGIVHRKLRPRSRGSGLAMPRANRRAQIDRPYD